MTLTEIREEIRRVEQEPCACERCDGCGGDGVVRTLLGDHDTCDECIGDGISWTCGRCEALNDLDERAALHAEAAKENSPMTIGTKSVLFGAHCFFLHPWFVAAAWWKLYGFPLDPRLWVAFFVHDIGYVGKPNMDGPEGERHVEVGARIMSFLFDGKPVNGGAPINGTPQDLSKWLVLEDGSWIGPWGQFSLYHSRYYAKRNGKPVSRLCFADKLSFPLTPRWLYLPAVTATGEINEYLKNAQKQDSAHWKPTGYDKRLWHRQLCDYMTKWVDEHKDGAADTWTDANRHAKASVSWTSTVADPAEVPGTAKLTAPVHNEYSVVWDLVQVDMRERNRVGTQHYGTPLQPFNGRDSLVDAYQEALDLVVYLRTAIYERDKR